MSDVAVERIGNPDTLHKRIVRLKTEAGQPRPEGLTLSLVNAVGPNTYWSNWCVLWNMPYRRRLSMDPDDYEWEDHIVNLQRNAHDNTLYLERGLITYEDGVRTYHGPIDTVGLAEWAMRGGPKRQRMVEEYFEKVRSKRERGLPAAVFEGVEYH